MSRLKYSLLCCLVFCAISHGWLSERPILKSEQGNLFIVGAKDKNLTLSTSGQGNINVNEFDLLRVVWAASNASSLVERLKNGVLSDIQTSLQRLSDLVEGPNGLMREINFVRSANTSRSFDKSTDDSGISISLKARINTRFRRLENKVRVILKKLRQNECRSDPCQNGGTCIDGYDSYQCHCPPQWEGKQCADDVNECQRLQATAQGCQNGATCVNLQGSYRCQCATGWHGFHCTSKSSVCDEQNNDELCGNGVCLKTNSPIGYTCICKQGWEPLSPSNPSCRKDVDECTSSRYPCSVNPLVTCHNVPGSFYCGTCPEGYTGDGFRCQDVDECLRNNGGCSVEPMVQCINTLGSRQCGNCPTGYDGDGVSCSYVGSCAINNGGCHSRASCREGPNSRAICLCPSGYRGDGRGPDGCRPIGDDPCRNNTCKTGEVCRARDSGAGYVCETSQRRDPCESNPCYNGGTCHADSRNETFTCECPDDLTGKTCRREKVCGTSSFSALNNPVGHLRYPMDGMPTDRNNHTCWWIISANETMVVNVTFRSFKLPSANRDGNCEDDYIRIFDGGTLSHPVIGIYCGDELPNNGTILSSQSDLLIWYQSTKPIKDQGFALDWQHIPPICGGSMRQEFGAIYSPNFPAAYPDNRDCFWTIRVSPGKRIVVTVLSMLIEAHPTCEKDYLEIHETNYLGQHELGRFCGHAQPNPITSSGSRLTVHFHSDGAGSGIDTGFHLSFLAVAGSPDCGGIYTSDSGVITSPGYHSGGYQAGMICDWEIRLPTSSKVLLKFLDFSVERSPSCMYDSLQIYEGTDVKSPLVGKYCSYTLPAPLVVNSSRILIRFESDANIEEKGFVLKYEIDCGGVFTEPTGVITSPFYPNRYPGSKDCVYLIAQPAKKSIALTFQFMDIEDGAVSYEDSDQLECYFDKLEIRDGDTRNSSLLRTLCGPDHYMPREPIYSTFNYMFLEFFTDANVHNLGFKANYSTIDRECGGIIKEAPGTLDIPGTDVSIYTNDCLWTIRAPLGHAIQVTWLNFPNQESVLSMDCNSNFIEMFEGYLSNDSKSLGRYCASKVPPQTMTTQGNDLTFLYHMPNPSDRAGSTYQASYSFVNDTINCGGRYFSATGTLRSPNYPKKYPKNKSCVWLITAQNKYVVTLNVSSFELETSQNCNYDYLEIRSGSQGNSPLLGKYCGSQIPSEITSMTNQMYIKFVSDTSLQDKGFEIHWHSATTGCGGRLTTPSGAVMSPNYPQNYYHQTTCTWNIRVAAGSVIQIVFIDFDLEDHVSCIFDYLEVADLMPDSYSQNKRRFCGQNSPGSIVTRGNQARLTFHSDVFTNSRGFHLKYQTQCRNNVTGLHGVIESPNFPESYSDAGGAENCSWIVTVPAGNTINVTFSHVRVQACDSGGDYILIKEGDNGRPSRELAKICENNETYLDVAWRIIRSTQRQIFITLVSGGAESANSATSFRLEWYANGCSQRLSKASGKFTSPGYPEGNKVPYPFVECHWIIEVDVDKSIEITFPRLETTRTHTCHIDGSLEIFNGPDESAPQLADNLCYSSTPVTYTSTGHRMLVKYTSTPAYASYGFEAVYRSVPLRCGGKFATQFGVIHSANYPGNYPHNQWCEWLITVDAFHAVNLTFVELDIEKSRNCSDDYVKVYDGATANAPLLATYCEAILSQASHVSTGNQMLVTMRTDSMVSAKGFKATYNQTCGARIIADGQGELSSTKNLLYLDDLYNCSYIIVAKDPADKITLSFTHVEFVDQQYWTNKIEIYDGEGIDGILLGTISSNEVPMPFYSSGNALTVHFVTDDEGLYWSRDSFSAIYSTLTTACGGNYTAESGLVASPNYPYSYPSNADCIWLFNSSPGNRIFLTFNDFQLIDSENCDVDYLEIREVNGIGKLVGVFCGTRINVVNSLKPLWMRFRSAAATASGASSKPKGFQAQYGFLYGNDDISGDSGEIASPTYPRPYKKIHTYHWRVTVPFNYVVQVQMLDINIESDDESCFSSLKFFDGFDNDAPKLDELCGISTSGKPIVSSGNVMYIEMENNFNTLGNWFHLKWTKVPRKAITLVDMIDRVTKIGNDTTVILTKSNASYAFRSPGYPRAYNNSVKYTWNFEAPYDTHITLKFIVLDLEQTENCLGDRVLVDTNPTVGADSSGSSDRGQKLCLSNATMNLYTSTSNFMTVTFETDSVETKTGFSAIVYIVCGGQIERSSGAISINNSPNEKIDMFVRNCEWVVKVRPGKRITFQVVVFEEPNKKTNTAVDESRPCRSNYYILQNGGSADSPLLGDGKYCRSWPDSWRNTSSNQLFVKLSMSQSNLRFKLVFRELGYDCGGNFQLSKLTSIKQEIGTPNYPNIPHPHTECIWTIMSLDDSRLSIHFTGRFDLAFTVGCEKEYVEVRDGGTEFSPLLGRFCRNQAPSTITSQGNIMYVHYFTDVPEPRNGFKAMITTGDVCGGIEREPRSGVISSPNYPETYATKSNNCSWLIVSPSTMQGVQIQFEDIDLPSRRNCSETDHVAVYEKNLDEGENFTLIGTYCGRRSPGLIQTSSRTVLVEFENSFANARLPAARGFRLNYTYSFQKCGGQLSGAGGYFQTTDYPRVSGYQYCSWRIQVQEGYRVSVDVIDLDLSFSRGTVGSHLSFHNDPHSMTTIALIRNSSQSMTVSSTSNYMSIYYVSIGGHRGMKAKFTAKYPAPCGGKHENWQGVLSSPSSPTNYTTFYCQWTVNSPKLESNETGGPSTLSLTASGLVSKDQATKFCPGYFNYVTVRGNEPIAKICGNFTRTPLTVLSPYKSNSLTALSGTLFASNFNISYKWHNCGGLLLGPSHVIESPTNVSSYPVYCAWKVKYPDSETISVSFDRMNLGSCNESYLHITSRVYKSPTLGMYCDDSGKSAKNFDSPSNQLYIQYYAASPGKSFKISVDVNATSCGGLLKGRNKLIRSPGFPSSYPSNVECVWDIMAKSGYHVGLTFVERFNLETSKNCQNDYVEIFDWYEDPYNNTGAWKSLARVCGRNSPDKPFNSTGRKMRVKFVSNSAIEADGFKAVWTSVCGGLYEATESLQYIESPNFPLAYPSNSFCNYTIVAPDDMEITVNFTNFALEGRDAECRYDNLTIYRGQYQHEKVYCGDNSPEQKNAPGRLEIVFRSDNSIGRRGFKFHYSFNDCGGIVTSPRMIKPFMETGYGFLNCVWIAKAPADKSVVLRVEEFNVKDWTTKCEAHYLHVYEGNSTELKDRRAAFCNDAGGLLPVIQSIGNVMTIALKTFPYGTDVDKFKAAVFFVDGPNQGCGGNVNLAAASVGFKTQKAQKYSPYADCHWLIVAPEGQQIRFSIDRMDVKITINGSLVDKAVNCSGDYLELRDGGPFAKVIFRICGSQAPPPVVSTSHLLFLRFVSDGIHEGLGVEGSLKALESPCGKTNLDVRNYTQVLTSPRYPENYPSAISCKWIVRTKESSLITFKDFDVKDSKDCEEDYLEISDDRSRNIASGGFGEHLIAGGVKYQPNDVKIASVQARAPHKYCGSELPHDFFSDFVTRVEIHYRVTSPQKGFKLEYGEPPCSQNYTALQGRIRQRKFADCWMNIRVPENYTISIYFHHLLLPATKNCSKCALEIREGGFNGSVLETICSKSEPDPIFSTTNSVSIHAFNTLFRGFSEFDLTYTSTKDGRGCGGRIYNYGGVFSSPLYPHPYRQKSVCTWEISVPRGMRVTIRFDVFDIGSKRLCETDNLSIAEMQSDGQKNVLITYCGEDVPAVFEARSDRVFVTYTTSVNNGGAGWLAYFSTASDGKLNAFGMETIL